MKIEDIEKLCAEATAAPWIEEIRDYSALGKGTRLDSLGPIGHWASYSKDSGLDIPRADIRFIAASRELMHKLLAVAQAAKAIRDECRGYDEIGASMLETFDRALAELERE